MIAEPSVRHIDVAKDRRRLASMVWSGRRGVIKAISTRFVRLEQNVKTRFDLLLRSDAEALKRFHSLWAELERRLAWAPTDALGAILDQSGLWSYWHGRLGGRQAIANLHSFLAKGSAKVTAKGACRRYSVRTSERVAAVSMRSAQMSRVASSAARTLCNMSSGRGPKRSRS